MENRLRLDIFKGSAAASIGTFSQLILYFITIIILTRSLPKSDFGIYILVISIADITNILTSLGLNLTLVKYIASERKSDSDFILLPVLITRIIVLFIAVVLLFFFRNQISVLFKINLSDFIFYIPIIFVLGSFRDLFFNLLQGLNLFRKFAFVQILSSSFRVTCIVTICLLHKLNLSILFNLEIIIITSTIFFQLLSIPYKMVTLRFPNWHGYFQIIKFSFPLYLNNICNYVIERANVMIIGAFLAPVSIAYYDVADKLPQAIKRVFNSFIIVFFPNISNLFSRKEDTEAKKLMNQYIVLFSNALSALILLGFLFNNEIITLLFSSKYEKSALAFGLMLIPVNIRAITSIIGHTLVAAGYPSVPVKANAISGIVGMAFSFYAIPRFDFLGAVYSVILMSLISFTVHYFYASRIKVKPYLLKFVGPFIVALLLSSIFVIFENISIIIKIFAAVIYVIGCYVLIHEFKSFFSLFVQFSSTLFHKNNKNCRSLR